MDLSFTTRTRAVRGARQSSRSGGTSVPQHVDNLIHFWPWRFRVGKSPSFFQGFRLGTMASPISRGIAFSKESGTATLGGVPGCAQDTVERRRASFARENVGKARVGAPCARLRPSPLAPPSTLYSLRPRTSRRGAARAGGARSAAVGRPHPHLPDREPQAEPPAEGRRRAAAHGAPSPRDAPQVVVVRPVSRRRGAGQRACARGAAARCRVTQSPARTRQRQSGGVEVRPRRYLAARTAPPGHSMAQRHAWRALLPHEAAEGPALGGRICRQV